MRILAYPSGYSIMRIFNSFEPFGYPKIRVSSFVSQNMPYKFTHSDTFRYSWISLYTCAACAEDAA